MNREYPRRNRFVDIEAIVDNDVEPDEEEEEDLLDPFIDNSDGGARENIHRPMQNHDRIAQDWAVTLAYEELLHQVLEDEHRNQDMHPRSWYSEDDSFFQAQELIRRPSDDDDPIYRVECRIGSEEMVVMSLLQRATEEHKLRAAFTRGSIRGCVYLECAMNPKLIGLLRRTPGISRVHDESRRRLILRSEYIQLLKMRDANAGLTAGEWVHINNGVYKGDIGLVQQTHSFAIEILLVPRLPYHPRDKKQKRKASRVRDPPKLFDPVEFQRTSDTTLTRIDNDTYKLGGSYIHCGLILKDYDYHSIGSRATNMPWAALRMFTDSGHPDIAGSPRPRPQEWSFTEEDKVLIPSCGKSGVIRKVEPTFAEVEFPTTGIHPINWDNLLKVFEMSDYVQHQGREGWVVEIKNNVATVLVKTTGGEETIGTSESDVQYIEAHVNCLVKAAAPFHFAPQATQPVVLGKHFNHHPWRNTDVIITKIGDPRKGDRGKIVDVVPSATGSRLLIEPTRYDPATAFKKYLVDIDDVVEASTRNGLQLFFELKNSLFNSPTSQEDISPGNYAGGSTPMPTESYSTPAWDPSLQTPLNIDLWSSPVRADQDDVRDPPQPTSIEAAAPQHVLLNMLLNGVKLTVVNSEEGQKAKPLQAKITMLDGRLRILQVYNKQLRHLEPDRVQPKYPNPTHYHGLVVVIQGVHCGKYARRLHHKHSPDGTHMILAVVERVTGETDALTGEELELRPEFLCIVHETDAEVKRHKAFMEKIRNTYRREKS